MSTTGISLGVNQTKRQADHLHLSITTDMNVTNILNPVRHCFVLHGPPHLSIQNSARHCLGSPSPWPTLLGCRGKCQQRYRETMQRATQRSQPTCSVSGTPYNHFSCVRKFCDMTWPARDCRGLGAGYRSGSGGYGHFCVLGHNVIQSVTI
jgi:hypothetical protein